VSERLDHQPDHQSCQEAKPLPPIDPHFSYTQAIALANQTEWAAVLRTWQNYRLNLSDRDWAHLSAVDRQRWADLLLQVWQEGDFQTRWEVSKVLAQFGPETVAVLLAVLADDADAETQWFAIRALGDHPAPMVVTTLLDLLQRLAASALSSAPSSAPLDESLEDSSSDLQTAAIAALVAMGETVLPHLSPLLATASSRPLAAQILANMRHSQTIPLLLPLTEDAQPSVRAIALEALSSFHQPAIAAALQRGLHDHATIVRRAAIRGVRFCWVDWPEADWVGQIQPLLRDLDANVCRQAAITLGRLGCQSGRSATATTTVATTIDPSVVIAALVEPLHSPHTPDDLAAEILRSLLWIETPAALAAIQDGWAVWPLVTPVRIALCRGLGHLETAALKPIATAQLLSWLQNALEQPDSLQETHLQSDFQNSPVSGRSAVRSSIQSQVRSQTRSQTSIFPVPIDLALAMVGALGQLGDSMAIVPLIAHLAQPHRSFRLHIVAALKQIDAEQALAHLKMCAVDPIADSNLSSTSSQQALAAGIQIALQEW
jgi:HEAT repeat protein